jgi:UDPglucose 6-dehydrogenase
MRVTVTGLGYLGLVHAATLAELGNHVLGMDIDSRKVKEIKEGRLPFHEPELGELVARHLSEGRLALTDNPVDVAKFAAAHFLCVGTPVLPSGDPDLSCLFDATRMLVPHFKGERNFIIGKSTTPPGTGGDLLGVARGLAPAGVTAEVAWNPEFLREGVAVQDCLYPERLVFGVGSEYAESVLRGIYVRLIASHTPVVVTDVRGAELGKLAANAFLAMKISFINGVAQYCDRNGGDPRDVARVMGSDHRIGGSGMTSGLGYGGGCLPKDTEMLTRVLDDGGARQLAGLLKQVTRINVWRRHQVVILAGELLGGFQGKRIAVLGVAFKAGTSDTRESPGLHLAHLLSAAGASVVVYDPHAGDCDFDNADTVADAVRGADLVIVTTADPEFTRLDPGGFPGGKVIDGRYALSRGRWEAAGWDYHEVGR